MNDEILLLIAAYLRKANHPTETDVQIDQNVRIDLAKIIRARAAKQAQAMPPAEGTALVAAENARAAALES